VLSSFLFQDSAAATLTWIVGSVLIVAGVTSMVRRGILLGVVLVVLGVVLARLVTVLITGASGAGKSSVTSELIREHLPVCVPRFAHVGPKELGGSRPAHRLATVKVSLAEVELLKFVLPP
jgi:hypothetical protein